MTALTESDAEAAGGFLWPVCGINRLFLRSDDQMTVSRAGGREKLRGCRRSVVAVT